MKRFATLCLPLLVAVGCSDGSSAPPSAPPPPPPPPLETVFEGAIEGVARAEVEAACKATPLPAPNADWQYVIRQLDRTVSRTFDNPWPGRADGDVHARETATVGRLRFSCTPRQRSGSTGTQTVVELGQADAPVVTIDVKVCEANGAGGSRATSINSGQVACPYAFGNVFPAVTDFSAAGPYATLEQLEGPRCTIFRPATLGENGRRHPVILFANGITLWPAVYRGLLRHMASHGFVVAATDTSRVGSAGNGQNLLACLKYLEDQNVVAGGVYQNRQIGRAHV